jgi:hypothetical protein
MMNSFDFLIIYLTCGAPLGVFYFLQNRKEQNGIRLWLKTFFTFIFWLPYGFRLLLQNKASKKFFTDKKIFSKSEKMETEIFLFQKQLEEILQKSDLQISIFEFREVIERYVGLTLAKDCGNTKKAEAEKEIFRIANSGNVEIGAICLNRRNLKRLTFHQIQARQDFFQVISQLVKFASDEEEFVKSAAGFFQLLNDTEAQSALGKALFDNLRNKRDFAANHSENFLWNTEIHKLPPAKSTTLHLQTLTATANSPAKD